MSCKAALKVDSLCKSFHIYRHTWERVLGLMTGRQYYRNFQALQQISFELAPGEALGIIGENGSGKSTLLKLIAGILVPDSGNIFSTGTVTGLLELGTGFNPELSGRRNIYLNGVYLGLSRGDLKAAEEEIVDFAEVGEFIDSPLKTWSSGMIMRLGFAIAIHANPKCFIIDEALSVGDARFQQKCFAKINEFRSNGGSLLFVSHDLNAVRLICDRVLLLSHGAIRYLGDPEIAVNRFYELLAGKNATRATPHAGYGNGLIRFTAITLTDEAGKPRDAFVSGQGMQIHFNWEAAAPIQDATFGFTIRDRMGQDLFGTNGALLNTLVNVAGAGQGLFEIGQLNLQSGSYTISLAAHTGFTHLENCFHWWDNAISFDILEDPDYRFCGLARLPVHLLVQNVHLTSDHTESPAECKNEKSV